MRPRLRTFLSAARDMSESTTIHGLLHIFLSKDKIRRAFWLILFSVALLVGTVHMVKLVRKYTQYSVVSQLKLKSEEAKFPDVTICNLKPASTALTSWGRYFKYLNNSWGSFNNWFEAESEKSPHESERNYEIRLVKVCKKLLDVMWVSADTRDISHMDETMLLHCRYNGKPCTHRNFSLVQTSTFWNCYTFHAGSEHSSSGPGGRGAQLEMILFTDGYKKPFSTRPIDRERNNLSSSSSIVMTTSCFERVLRDQAATNTVLQGGQPESTGLRLFLHENRSYPLSRSESMDVASGRSTKIELRPLQNHMLSISDRRCSQPPLGKVIYVRHFSNASQNVVTKEYTKSVADFVIEAKQNIIHKNCGCYSHKHPFWVNTSELCYYAPPKHWITPSDAVLRRIQCHDKWFERAERRGSKLAKEFRHKRWCKYTRQRAWQQSSSWPPFSAVPEIWADLIVPQIKDGIEFRASDGKVHHIYNDPRDGTRQELQFLNLLLYDKDCLNYFCSFYENESRYTCNRHLMLEEYKISSPCVEQRSLSQNLAAISITLRSPAADAYVEEDGSHWTEALSEIGGALGLWLGISIVSAFELLEFVYVVVQLCRRNETSS